MAHDPVGEGLEAMCITDLLLSSGWFFISTPAFFPITKHVYFNCLPSPTDPPKFFGSPCEQSSEELVLLILLSLLNFKVNKT